MKTNFKKVCATLTTIAIIGAISTAAFATDQPDNKKTGAFVYGDDKNGVAEQSISITDKNGNILDEDGNIIGNIKDLPAVPEDFKAKVDLSSTDKGEDAEKYRSISISGEDGNILDEDGNIIGNIKDLPAVPEDFNQKVNFSTTNENKDSEEQNHSISITDKDGNILDENGNIIGNIKDLPAVPEGAEVDAELSSINENEASQKFTVKAITIDDDGNILDENGNILGNIISL